MTSTIASELRVRGLVSIGSIRVMVIVILVLIGCSIFMPLSLPAESDVEMFKATRSSSLSQELAVKIWHHDCSNTTGFRNEYLPEPIAVGIGGYRIFVSAEGSLESNGQSLYLFNVTEPSTAYGQFYYGPTVVCDLPDIFPVSGLRNLSVQIELVNSNPEYLGIAAVALFDESLAPILIASCYDYSSSIAMGILEWHYYPRYSSTPFSSLNKEWWDYSLTSYEDSLSFVNATWSASYTSDQGVWGYIPATESVETLNGSIITGSETEVAREIKYLGIMLGGCFIDYYRPIPPFRIHDISLEYETGGDIDTSPPLLTPQLDRVCIVGQTGNTITWRCTDDHPYRFGLFDIFHHSWDSSPILIEEGLWNGSHICMSIDGLEIGTYVFLLYLEDNAGFMITDIVEVRVIEHPLISAFVSLIKSHPEIIVIASVVVVGIFFYLRDWRKAVRYRKERISLYKKQWSSAPTSL